MNITNMLVVLVAMGTLPLLIVAIALVIGLSRKETRQRKKISREVEKIDGMLGHGRITGEEARELKQALGTSALITAEKSRADKHIMAVSIIHVLYGFLLIGAVSLFISSIRTMFAPELSGSSPFAILPKDEIFETINLIVSITIPIFLLGAVLQLTSAVLLLKRSRQARMFILLFSIIFLLPSFPLGTAFGIYSLWVLFFREGAEAYFPEKG